METIAETTTKPLPLPPFRGGAIFNVSVDSPREKGKPRRTAPPMSTGTSTARSGEQTRLPLQWSRLSLTHNHANSNATSMMNLSVLMATTSTRPQAPT